MSDSQELESLFDSSNIHHEKHYKRIEYLTVADEQAGDYSGGQISFNLLNHKAKFTVLSDSYLTFPLNVTVGTQGAAPAGNFKIAVKNSLLSLIQGVQVSTSDGKGLVNEQLMSVPIMANLRLMLDSSIDFLQCNELHYYGHSENITSDVSGRGNTLLGGTSHHVTANIPTIDPVRNPSLASRIAVFDAHSTTTTQVAPLTSYDRRFVVYLPLRFIHPIFEVLDFPLTQSPLTLTFNIAGAGSWTAFHPWVSPSFAACTTTGLLGTGLTIAPAAAPADAAAAQSNVTGALLLATVTPALASAPKSTSAILTNMTDRQFISAPKLYLKSVHMHQAEGLAYIAKIKSGFKKSLVYSTADYKSFVILGGAGTVSIDQQIGTSYVRPTRVWVMPVPRVAGVQAMASHLSSFPATFGSGNFLFDANLKINDDTFYQNPIKSQYDFYRLLKREMTAGFGHAPISYTDFVAGGINPYVFDISRNETVSSNVQCSLTLVCGLANSSGAVPPTDLIIITERAKTLLIQMNEDSVTMFADDGLREAKD